MNYSYLWRGKTSGLFEEPKRSSQKKKKTKKWEHKLNRIHLDYVPSFHQEGGKQSFFIILKQMHKIKMWQNLQ